MKHINLITTLSPQQHNEIHRWWVMSCISLLVVLGAVSYFAIPQLYNVYELKKNVADLTKKTVTYTDVTTKKNSLKKENVALSRKKKRIETYRNDPRNPYNDLAIIAQAISSSPIKIEQIRSNKKTIDLIINCINPET